MDNLESRWLLLLLLPPGELLRSPELLLFRAPPDADVVVMTLVQGDPGSDDPDGFDPIPVMDDDMPSKSLMSCHSFGDDGDAAAAEDACCCLGEPDDEDGTQSPLLSAATLAAAAAMAPWTAAEAVAMATTVVAICRIDTNNKKNREIH